MSSNYPPVVTGSEDHLTGYEDADWEALIEECIDRQLYPDDVRKAIREAESLRQQVAELEAGRTVAPEGYVLMPEEAWKFLAGEAPMHGHWFSDEYRDDKTEERKPYWWRSVIRGMLSGSHTGQPTPTNWLTCQGNEMPETLAPAQIVELYTGLSSKLRRADKVNWRPGLQYRPALDADGLFMVSRAGLEPWAKYVATDEDGEVWQYSVSPVLSDLGPEWINPSGKTYNAPDTHKIPRDWRDSLASVYEEG